MHNALIVILLFITFLSPAQQTEWGITISPIASKGKLPSGVGVAFAGPPFWVGDVVVETPYQNGMAIEVFREKSTRIKKIPFTLKSSLGYLSCGTYQHYDYDYANSINNIVNIENRFRYITFNTLIKYNINIKKVKIFASIGPHIGYLIYLLETSENYMPNGPYSTASYNFVSSGGRYNYGLQYAIGGSYKGVSMEVYYRPYANAPGHDTMRPINYGLAVSYVLWKTSKN